MLQENPGYRIRLHGHTNGDQGRDMVTLGESQNLFATDQANKQIAGSAKELSSLMAETVKIYLVNNGIESSRIATRGEGGKQMIFDPKSTLASGNDRVEVEVIRH
jgi:outer membrane protein OmpA-like peptidoglycan-associated protein